MAAFAHMGNTTARDQVRRHAIQRCVGRPNFATAHLALFQGQQTRHRFERGRFASPIRAQQRHHGTLGHMQGQAAQHLDGVVVNHLDVFDAQCGVDDLFSHGHQAVLIHPLAGSNSLALASKR